MLLLKSEQIAVFWFSSASGNDMISHQRSTMFCSYFKQVWTLGLVKSFVNQRHLFFCLLSTNPCFPSIKAGFLRILASMTLKANRILFDCLFQKKTLSVSIRLGPSFIFSSILLQGMFLMIVKFRPS